MYVCVCVHSPPTPLVSRLLCNIEQSSTCYTVDPFWLSVLNIAMRDEEGKKIAREFGMAKWDLFQGCKAGSTFKNQAL